MSEELKEEQVEQLDTFLTAFLKNHNLSIEEFIEQIETEGPENCIISEIESFIQGLKVDVIEKESMLHDILNQFILKKYQLRHKEEKNVLSLYEQKLTELDMVVANLNKKLKESSKESSFLFDKIDKFSKENNSLLERLKELEISNDKLRNEKEEISNTLRQTMQKQLNQDSNKETGTSEDIQGSKPVVSDLSVAKADVLMAQLKVLGKEFLGMEVLKKENKDLMNEKKLLIECVSELTLVRDSSVEELKKCKADREKLEKNLVLFESKILNLTEFFGFLKEKNGQGEFAVIASCCLNYIQGPENSINIQGIFKMLEETSERKICTNCTQEKDKNVKAMAPFLIEDEPDYQAIIDDLKEIKILTKKVIRKSDLLSLNQSKNQAGKGTSDLSVSENSKLGFKSDDNLKDTEEPEIKRKSLLKKAVHNNSNLIWLLNSMKKTKTIRGRGSKKSE